LKKVLTLVIIVLLIVSMFSGLSPKVQAFSNPYLVEVGISYEEYSTPITPPITQTPGGHMRLWYHTYNPNSYSVNVILGASIKIGSSYYNDPSHDKVVTLYPGNGNPNRYFYVPSGVPTGSYTVIYAIWATDWSVQYDSVSKSDWVNMVSSVSVQISSSPSNVGTITWDSVTHSLPKTIYTTTRIHWSGTDQIHCTPPTEYEFHHWESSGAVDPWDEYSQWTNVDVDGSGSLKAVFSAISIPPSLTLYDPSISDRTVTINGVASPGTAGTTITRIHWNWGDGYSEDHWFPASHTYGSYGDYTITVTAYQSDGLYTTKTKYVSLPPPQYTVTIDPNGGRVYVDSSPITSVRSYTWAKDSTHTLDPDSGYQPSSGTKLIFARWSDGNTADPRSITVTGTATYTVQWTTQYQLTIGVSPSGAGTTNPSVGTYWYNKGTNVVVSETHNTGYTFDHWELDGNNVGNGASYSVSMNAPHALTAVFSEVPTPDFSISNPGTITISDAEQRSATITLTEINGYSSSVSLSATGQPSGISIVFTPVSGTPTFTSTITIKVGYDVPLDTYPITVVGAGSDGTIHSITFSLIVIAGTGTTTATNSVPKQTLMYLGSETLGLGTIDLNSETVTAPGDYQLSEGILTIQDPYTIPLVVTLSAFGHSHTFDIGYISFSNTMQGWISQGGESVWVLKAGPPYVEKTTSSYGDTLWQININILYQFDQLPEGSDSVSVTLDLDKSLESIPPDLVENFIIDQLLKEWQNLVTNALLLSDVAPMILASSFPLIQVATSHFVMSGVFFTALTATLILIAIGSVSVIVASPANILVISPEGKMVGISPTGEILNQINGAVYSHNQTNDEKLIWIANATSGQYQITLNGTDFGEYNLGLFFVNGTYTFSQEFAGTTAPSAVNHFVENVEVSAEPSAFAFVREYMEVLWDQNIFYVVVESNSTISEFNFVQTEKEINFNVTGPDVTVGFCNATIPKELLNADPVDWIVLIDAAVISPIISANETHTMLYFTYSHTTHQVRIIGTHVASYPVGGIYIPVNKLELLAPYIGLTILLAVAVVTVVYVKKRKRNTEILS